MISYSRKLESFYFFPLSSPPPYSNRFIIPFCFTLKKLLFLSVLGELHNEVTFLFLPWIGTKLLFKPCFSSNSAINFNLTCRPVLLKRKYDPGILYSKCHMVHQCLGNKFLAPWHGILNSGPYLLSLCPALLIQPPPFLLHHTIPCSLDVFFHASKLALVSFCICNTHTRSHTPTHTHTLFFPLYIPLQIVVFEFCLC